jgi:hypothetical protein
MNKASFLMLLLGICNSSYTGTQTFEKTKNLKKDATLFKRQF